MVKADFLLFCLTSLICGSLQGAVAKANYNPETDGVVELTPKNFRTLVLNSEDAWTVVFDYPGPDCSPCVKLSEIVKKAVPLLKGKNIKVGYVDCSTTDGQTLKDTYGITMLPVSYIFGRDKGYPFKYPFSARSPEEYADAVEFLLNKSPAAEGQCGKDTIQDQDSNAYELTDENFEQVVLKCQDPWIVNFYAPGVPLCMQFMPYFDEAGKEFKGRVKFGSLFLAGSKVAEKYNVINVCTVKLFPPGNKDGPPVDYNNGSHGPTINTNLIPWIKTALASSLPAPEITELTSQSVLDSKCKNSGVSACIFLFLAKTDQCNADCKSASLNLLKQMAEDKKAEKWAWLWTTQGKQPDFEQTFGIKTFPGALLVDLMSKSYSVLRGTATESKLKEFLQFFSSGRLPAKNMPPNGFPSVKNN